MAKSKKFEMDSRNREKAAYALIDSGKAPAKIAQYETTSTSCKCMDHAIRVRSSQVQYCKHQFAVMVMKARGGK